jgi:energy-coupling factor transport system substrate-specific component
MNKKYILIACIIALATCAFMAPVFSPSPLDVLTNWALVGTVLIGLTAAAFFFQFEGTAAGSKEVALVGMLGTVSAVLRIPFAAVPSVQPCTYLIICAGYVFGPTAGFMVGAITALVSNFFLGQGPWTVFQIFAWGMAGVSASYFRRFNLGRKELVALGVAWGYLFGVIINSWFWTAFVYPLTPRTFLVAQLNSVWFDTAHAIGNAVFLGVFGTKTIAILERFRLKFQWGTVKRVPETVVNRAVLINTYD